jgi:hypothetical protein
MERLWVPVSPLCRRMDSPWVSSWFTTSESKDPSRSGLEPVKMYICVRPTDPSAPWLDQLALLVPEPSCASART